MSAPPSANARSIAPASARCELPRAAREVPEDRGAGQRVGQRAMRRVGVYLGRRRERLQRIGRRGGLDDRRELDGVEAIARRQAGALEEGEIEADVVPEDRHRAEERVEPRERDLRPWRAGQILVADAGEARDDRLERRAGIDERGEALANAHRAFAVERHARGADLDDAICGRVEPGRFEV